MEDKRHFSDVIADYIEREGISRMEFARRIGVPNSTVGGWLTERPDFKRTNMDHRAKLCRMFPELEDSREITAAQESAIMDFDMLTLRHHVESMSPVMRRLLEEGSEADRNRFRRITGPRWTDFYSQVAALCSEKALEVAVKEGRVNGGQSNDTTR